MSAVRHILLLVLAFTLQTTWVDSLKVWSIKPDLLIMTLNFITLRSGPVVGAYMGLGVGILQDIYLPANLGVNALAKSLTSAGSGYIHTHAVADSIQVQAGLIFFAVLCHDLIYYLGTGAAVPFEWSSFFGRAVYTGLISAIFLAGSTLKRHLFPA